MDRCEGCDVGLYRSTVTDQYVDYIRPQDCGGKTAVRWATLTDTNGRGVKITCDAPFFLQALHFTRDDLDQARHRPGDPRRDNPLQQLRPDSAAAVPLQRGEDHLARHLRAMP